VTQGISHEGPARRFDEQVVALRDPDGLSLELVTAVGDDRPGWGAGPVPAEHAVRGVHGVALWEDGYELTAQHLTGTMGLRLLREEGNRFRYAAGEGKPGSVVDIVRAPGFWQGVVAVGTVHHVAWRTADDKQQLCWREQLAALGLNVTPVRDRHYFRSIYFREPGGVLFEIATDGPGFTVDEAPDALGTHLKRPPGLEPVRPRIEEALPPNTLPAARGGSRTAAG
jgi:catechol 2,3-dioxygenase-like lactoylglutathione lyase family enzyme